MATSGGHLFTTCKQSLQRLCFYTCLSVILFMGEGGVCHSACWDTHPLGSRHPQEQTPPGSRHPLWEQTPPGAEPPPPKRSRPPAQCMLGTSGWYASYWNAYLFMTYFYRARRPWPPRPPPWIHYWNRIVCSFVTKSQHLLFKDFE